MPGKFRYEELADFVGRLVGNGTLRPGERVPSVRAFARQRGASVTTVLQAYHLLEDRGVLEARPQSGFYVARPSGRSKRPRPVRPPESSSDVDVTALVFDILKHAGDPSMAPLGCAIPSAELLAASKLDRLLARTARSKGTAYNAYTLPEGDPELRREIARRAARFGHTLAPEDILITCGCTEALTLSLRAVTRRGDTVAVESPTYFGLLQVLEALELKALELPTDAETGIDPAALERALTTNSVAACLFSSNFNNPLGCATPEGTKLAILDLLARFEVPLIEDDIYGDIYFGRERPRPYMSLRPSNDILYCSSFSKTLAPGYRVGWIATCRRMKAVVERKFASTLCGPALPQAALAAFLNAGGYDNHLRRMRQVLRANVQRMSNCVSDAFPQETRISHPDGGFVLWLELAPGVDSRALLARALPQRICFAPGHVFSAGNAYAHCLRLSCGHVWSERIERAVVELGVLAGRR